MKIQKFLLSLSYKIKRLYTGSLSKYFFDFDIIQERTAETMQHARSSALNQKEVRDASGRLHYPEFGKPAVKTVYPDNFIPVTQSSDAFNAVVTEHKQSLKELESYND